MLPFEGLKPLASTVGGLVSALSHIPNAGPFDQLRAGCGAPGFVRGGDRWNRRSFPFALLRVRMTVVRGMTLVWISALLSWMRLRRGFR